MEQKYVYRVLRKNEIIDKGLGEGLYSKSFNMEANKIRSFGATLDNISTHILNGNKSETEFISCSSDLIIDLQKYATEQLEIRPYIAVIKDHSKSTIESDKFDFIKKLYALTDKYDSLIYNENRFELIGEYETLIKNHNILKHCYNTMMNLDTAFRWKIPKTACLEQIRLLSQSDIKKFVIDASKNIYTDELYMFFMKNRLIFNKDESTKESINQWEYGTARNSSEILVLNNIKRSDFVVLNPLQYDILYCLINNYSLYPYQINEKIIDLLGLFSLENFENVEKNFNNKIDLLMLQDVYYRRIPIYNIVETVDQFNTFINLKKQFLSRCVDFMNEYYKTKYSDKFIFTLEESIDLYNSPVIEVVNGKILKKIK